MGCLKVHRVSIVGCGVRVSQRIMQMWSPCFLCGGRQEDMTRCTSSLSRVASCGVPTVLECCERLHDQKLVGRDGGSRGRSAPPDLTPRAISFELVVVSGLESGPPFSCEWRLFAMLMVASCSRVGGVRQEQRQAFRSLDGGLGVERRASELA